MGDPNTCDFCGELVCDCPEPVEPPFPSPAPWRCLACGGCRGTCETGPDEAFVEHWCLSPANCPFCLGKETR
jgi:hypothetical protein